MFTIIFGLSLPVFVANFQWIQEMAEAGANQYTFHIEATADPMTCIRQIKEANMKVRQLPVASSLRLSYFTTIFVIFNDFFIYYCTYYDLPLELCLHPRISLVFFFFSHL